MPDNSTDLLGGSSSSWDQQVSSMAKQLNIDTAKTSADVTARDKQATQIVSDTGKNIGALQEKYKIPEAPKVDKAPEDDVRSPLQAFGSYATAFAVLGSLLTRRPLTSSLNAAGDAMKAMYAYDIDKWKRKTQVWKENTDAAFKIFDAQQSQYRDVLEDKRLSLDEMTARVGTLATLNHDEVAMTQLRAGRVDLFERLFNDRETLQQNAKREADALWATKGQYDKWETEFKKQNGRDPSAQESLQQIKQIADAGIGLKGSARTNAQATTLTPEAIDMAAQIYLSTKQLPAFGMGGIGDRSAIINRASELAGQQGLTTNDILSGAAQYHADSMSLTNLQKMYDAGTAFEETMIKNIGIVKGLMEKGAGTEAGPVVNRWLQAGKIATGDPDVKAFDAAIKTAMDEYAKVLSGNTSGGQRITDAAMNQTNSMLSAWDSPAAISRVIDSVILPDAKNRIDAYIQQLDTIRGRVGSSGVGGQGGDIRTKARAAFGSYEPDKYDYGINPTTGKFARRAKEAAPAAPTPNAPIPIVAPGGTP